VARSKVLRLLPGYFARRVTKAHCESWLTQRGPQLSPQSFAHELSAMKAVFDYAVAAGLILGNPASHLKRRRITQAEISIPTREQFQQIIAAIRASDGRADSQRKAAPNKPEGTVVTAFGLTNPFSAPERRGDAGQSGAPARWRRCPSSACGRRGAADKRVALKALGDIAWLVAAQVSAYASKAGNLTLQARVGFSRTALMAGGDQGSVTRCRAVHTAATENLAGLAKYRVDAAKLTEFDNAIKAFQALITAPRDSTTQSSSATKQLPGLFQKADALLKDQLDNLMASYATSEPTFHGEYGAARVIVDAGGGAAKAPPAPAPAPAA
jgi:hypothetical protein